MTFEELVKSVEKNNKEIRLPSEVVLGAIQTTEPSMFDRAFEVLSLHYDIPPTSPLEGMYLEVLVGLEGDEDEDEYIYCQARVSLTEEAEPIENLDPEILAKYYKGNIDLTETPVKKDVVNHPSHYTQGTLEVIDIMDDKMSCEEFKGFLKGNVLKYLFRSPHKGTEKEDLEKCSWYLNRLINKIHEENWGK